MIIVARAFFCELLSWMSKGRDMSRLVDSGDRDHLLADEANLADGKAAMFLVHDAGERVGVSSPVKTR
jgi:hypothetical protein